MCWEESFSEILMCSSCLTRKAVARGLCRSCYNKAFWSLATPEQLEKRRQAVKDNYNAKKLGTFTRTIMLTPSEEETRLRVNRFVRERRAYAKHVIDQVKIQIGCTDCGYNDSAIALDFDHVNGEKEMGISKAVSRCWSLDRIFQEIEKCEVRCANCHRLVTYERLEK